MATLTKGIILDAEVEFLAVGRRATPQKTPQTTETRRLGRDRVVFGPAGAGSFGRDRFAGGEASSGLPDSGAQGPIPQAEPLRDRFAGGSPGAAVTDRMLGVEGQVTDAVPSNGPVLRAAQFKDDYQGGLAGRGIQDRNAGATGDPGIQDRNAGGMVGGDIQDRYTAGAGNSGVQDRNLGGMVDDDIQDRMEGGNSADLYMDRYQGGEGGPSAEDRYEGMEQGGFERGRLELPEGVQSFAVHSHRGTPEVLQMDDALPRGPMPFYETVELLQNIVGLRKRIAAIQVETADIRKRLPSALWATAPNALPIKVGSRLKKKLPK